MRLDADVASMKACRLGAIRMLAITGLLINLGSHVSFIHSQASDAPNDNSPATINQVWQDDGWKFPDGWQPVTDEAAIKTWGQAFERATREQDTSAFEQSVSFDAMFDRCVSKIENAEFKKGFRRGLQSVSSKLLAKLADPKGSYRFLGVHNSELGPSAVMRMIDANGGCNYHFWRFQQDAEGSVYGVDLYVVLSGETFSDTMRRLAMISAPLVPKGNLSDEEITFSENQIHLLAMIQTTQAQDFEGVLDAYEKLPVELQQEKAIMLMRVLASMKVNQEEYRLALDDYQKQFPDDASADLATIDLYFLGQEFDKMLASIQRLQAAIGVEDAHLLMLKSVALAEIGKLDEARKTVEAASELEPTLEALYWRRIEVCLKQSDFDNVNVSLKHLCERFGYREFDFSVERVYEGYLDSPQHEEFLKYLDTLEK